MASKEVFVRADGVRLIGGLEWRVLGTSRSVNAGLRSIGSEWGSRHAATVTSGLVETVHVGKKALQVRRVAGGFERRVDDDSFGKKAHSLAAAFAAWAAEYSNAILLLPVAKGQHVVVVLKNGLPVLDAVVPDADAANALIAPYIEEVAGIPVFAADITRYPSSVFAGNDQEGEALAAKVLDGIADACNKKTKLQPLPINAVKVAGVAVTLLLAAGGYWAYSENRAEEERQKAIARAKESDPVPKYLAALQLQSSTLGIARTALIASFRAAMTIPTAAVGWRLVNVYCEKDKGCAASFERTTGTFESLAAEITSLRLQKPASVNFNGAVMVWDQAFELEGIDLGQPAVSLADFVSGQRGSQLQDWMVAGLHLQVEPPVLWPQVPGVSGGFKHPRAIAVGKFEVANISLPLMEEVLNSAPANVLWRGWEISFSDPKQKPLLRAKVRAYGIYYVQH